jgi:hypothetical protein
MSKPITQKQLSFIKKLREERGLEHTSEVAYFSTKEASDLIGELLQMPKVAKATANTPEPGFYFVDGEVIKVQENKAKTNSYAKVLHGTSWEYVGKSPFKFLTEDTKLTYEVAKAHGLDTNHCLICGAYLDNTESAQYGIGPTCHKNLTGMTFAQARKAGQLPPVVKAEEELSQEVAPPLDDYVTMPVEEVIEMVEAHTGEHLPDDGYIASLPAEVRKALGR